MAWILFGSILIIYPALTWSIDIPKQFWLKQILQLIFLIGIYVFNSRILVPRYLILDRYRIYTLSVLVVLLLMQVFSRWFDWATLLPQLMEAARGQEIHPITFSLDVFVLIITLMIVGMSTSVTLIGYYRLNTQLKEQAEKQHINAELTFLRSQINPHFFFNTLNTIYSLTYINVDHARESLLKLSRMMRYSLNKNEEGKTLVAAELNFIRDYVELMKMRMSNPSSVLLEINARDNDATVAPMLLIPFIENAFKYGADRKERGGINITINQSDAHFSLLVINQVQKEEEMMEKNQIGIANTQRRLNLLYPKRHMLQHGKNESTNTYVVNLTIEL